MSNTRIPITIFYLLLPAFAVAVFACEYLTVRDAAFEEPRDVHRLVLFAESTDASSEALAEGLRERLARDGENLNMEFLRVDVDTDEIDWSEFALPGPPPETPAAVLIGSNQRSGKPFFVLHWVPAPSEEELEAVISSPFRDRLAKILTQEVAAIVHAPGTIDPRGDVEALLLGIEADWDGREKHGVSLLTLDRNDPGERLLLSFLGIPKEGPDWAGIFFGRAKAMDPWVGEEIEEVQLNHQIETLIGECNCLMTAGSLGVDLPMVWTEAMDAERTFLREATDEDEPGALAGLKSSRILGGPLAAILVLFLAATLLGGGALWIRTRRASLPLVTIPKG